MRLTHLRVKTFRNIERLDIDFTPGLHLISGGNAQGKSSLLEAIYLLATLRSFRGATHQQMRQRGAESYFVGGSLEAPGQCALSFYWAPHERVSKIDGRVSQRVADLFDCVRMVVFSPEDPQLVAGAPRIRRRFIDLILAQTDPHYVNVLQEYARAIRSRNALLRRDKIDDAALGAFDHQTLRLGSLIMERRRDLIPTIHRLAAEAHANVSNHQDELSIDYAPNVKTEFAAELKQSRDRERRMQTTLVGPHRDDIRITINGYAAANFASEGQKRSAAIALRVAQTGLLTQSFDAPPILLIDDIFGELDPERRASLFDLLQPTNQPTSQAFVTSADPNLPRALKGDWTQWRVENGTFAHVPGNRNPNDS